MTTRSLSGWNTRPRALLLLLCVAIGSGLAFNAMAQDPAATAGAEVLATTAGTEAAAAVVDKGDVAWMLTSTLLVLLMTVPGLALSTTAWCGRRTCCRCWRR